MRHEFDFALTTYCQAKCRSCARTNEETGEKEDWLELKHMDFDMFKSRVEFSKLFQDPERVEVTFCGEYGDPMMHPRITDFIEYTAPKCRQLAINTNGGLRQPEWYAELGKRWKHVRINWGIDGTDAEINGLYREGVNFERAMENMFAWFGKDGEGGRGEWQFLIFDWNWHQIPEAYEIAKMHDINIRFKFNQRGFGLITHENRQTAYELLRSIDAI